MTAPNGSSTFSWATNRPDDGSRRNRLVRLGRRWRDATWFDAFAVLLFLAAFDVVTLLVLSGWQSTECGGSCGLAMQLHLLRVGSVVVPLALFLPPVVLSLVLRRRRLLIVVCQLALCVLLALNNLSEQHTIKQRLDGTAVCWNPLYSPKECPWGVR